MKKHIFLKFLFFYVIFFFQITNSAAENKIVVKVNENLVWLKNISYPFEIPTNEKLELNEEIFGTLVKVDDEWYLKEFSYEPMKTVYARI